MNAGCRVWGPDHAPTVLLLHCSLAHSGAWERVARALAPRYRLIAPDLVGHGAGPAGDPARDYHDQVTEQALALLPPAGAHVVGHSFGGTVALRLAIDAPARVRSASLIEPVLFAAAPSRERSESAARLSAMYPLIEAGRLREAARAFLSVWGGGTPFDALPPAQADDMAARMWVIAAQHDGLHLDAARLLPRLGLVRCPVLLLEGSTSPPVIGAIQAALCAGLGDARRDVVADAGHMAPISHGREVAERLRAFFAEVDAGGRALGT